tara:strand:- start:4098 stop:4745 length:648 start_codon:yes stop_codon:yes gene_type:complete
MDSVYELGKARYEKLNKNIADAKPTPKPVAIPLRDVEGSKAKELIPAISSKELALNHHLFFASNPLANIQSGNEATDSIVYVEVDGDQTVKANDRLRLRLTRTARINYTIVPKNTAIFGFVRFQPNRVLIEIATINHLPTHLKAFDLQDGSEGIYVQNSFRADATKEVVDDMVQDIAIAGVPQLSGLKKVFQRTNRNVKVTVWNTYKLILKTNNK